MTDAENDACIADAANCTAPVDVANPQGENYKGYKGVYFSFL